MKHFSESTIAKGSVGFRQLGCVSDKFQTLRNMMSHLLRVFLSTATTLLSRFVNHMSLFFSRLSPVHPQGNQIMDRDPMMNCSAAVLIRQPPGLWEDPPVMSAPRTRTPRFLSREALWVSARLLHTVGHTLLEAPLP